ncbi:17089_t:CDS:1, partial [Dentiscutata heterogama]
RFTFANKEILNNNVYIFDTLNYKWVKTLNRNNQTFPILLHILIVIITASVLIPVIIAIVIFSRCKEDNRNKHLT